MRQLSVILGMLLYIRNIRRGKDADRTIGSNGFLHRQPRTRYGKRIIRFFQRIYKNNIPGYKHFDDCRYPYPVLKRNRRRYFSYG